jgi:HAL2 family 3'(2'),5'-bisphosphate nucleotidase
MMEEPMYELEREIATKVVIEACGIGRSVQRDIVAAGDKLTKADRSPVTIADLAIQAIVSTRLAATFTSDPLLAEEDSGSIDGPLGERVLELVGRSLPETDIESLSKALDRGSYEGGNQGRFWVLDPVDGTKGFLRGEHYAIALALVENGKVVVGALGCPNLSFDGKGEGDGCIFTAVIGEGCTAQPVDGKGTVSVHVDDIIDPSQTALCESVESGHAAHSVHAEIAAKLGITKEPYRIDSQCKYGIVARGDASIYLRLPSTKSYREKVWDHAAGAIVIEEAGGRVSDLDGTPLNFSEGRYLATQRGIIATNGHIHDQVLAAARKATGL